MYNLKKKTIKTEKLSFIFPRILKERKEKKRLITGLSLLLHTQMQETGQIRIRINPHPDPQHPFNINRDIQLLTYVDILFNLEKISKTKKDKRRDKKKKITGLFQPALGQDF